MAEHDQRPDRVGHDHPPPPEDAVLTELLERVRTLEQRLADQASELVTLRAALGVAGSEPLPPPEPADAARPDAAERASRRAVLGRVAATAAALGLVTSLGSEPARAQTGPPAAPRADGGNLIVGGNTSASTSTRLYAQPAGGVNKLLHVDNNTAFQQTNPTGDGSLFQATLLGSHGLPAVQGKYGVGVWGYAPEGIGMIAQGFWPLQLTPQRQEGPRGTPFNSDNFGNRAPNGTLLHAGFYPGANQNEGGPDVLWWRTFAGGPTSPPTGTWRRIATGDMVGVLQAITPVRVVETRGAKEGGPIGFDASGAPIQAAPLPDGVTREYLIAGMEFQGFRFPELISGLLFNLTIVQAGPSGGFVKLYSGDVTQPPITSNVNPSAVTGISVNFGFTRIGNKGTIKVQSVGSIRDLVIDVMGYYF